MNIFLHNELWREIKYLLAIKNISLEEYIKYTEMTAVEIKKLRKAGPDEYPDDYLQKIYNFILEYYQDILNSKDHTNEKHIAKNILNKISNAIYSRKVNESFNNNQKTRD